MIFNFQDNYSGNDRRSFEFAQQEDTEKICAYLKTSTHLLENIKFEIFDSREGKQNADPHHSISRASARYNEKAIYRFWNPKDDPHFPHEITHLVAHTWTKPYMFEIELDTWDNKKFKTKTEMVSTSFMQEGLAVAVDDILFQRTLMEEGEHKFIDDWCRQQIEKIPTLTQCIAMHGFSSFENKVVIPFTASLSKFLLNTYGVDKYKEMYIALQETLPPEKNVKLIENIYNLSEKELLKKWIMNLMI